MITSKEIEHNYIEIGYNKCNMNIAKCFILAILANMFYIPAGIMALNEYDVEAEGLNWFNFFITNELPVTIGNLIGGISLSVALWFTQSQKAKK